jgi:hypothetical protein
MTETDTSASFTGVAPQEKVAEPNAKYGEAYVIVYQGGWRLRIKKFADKKNGTRAKTVEHGPYATQEAAESDRLIYEFALVKDHGRSFIQREKLIDGADRFQSYREEYDLSLTALAKRSSSSPNLNAIELHQFKKLKKMGKGNGLKAMNVAWFRQTLEAEVWNPEEIAKKAAHFANRGENSFDWNPKTTEKRIEVLLHRLKDMEKTYQLLITNYREYSGYKLLIRDDEEGPRKNSLGDDFTPKQASKANRQCQTLLMIHVKLMEKTREELALSSNHLTNMERASLPSVIIDMQIEMKVRNV